LYETIRRKYTRKYNVYTNNHHVGQSQILQTIGIPFVGGRYPFGAYGDVTDAFATCVSVKCTSTNHQKLWLVTAEFDTDRLLSQLTDNPLLQPADIFWESQTYEQPMRYDWYGIACNSTSGNQFDPPAMVEQARTLYRVVRNESLQPSNDPLIRTYDPMLMQKFRRKLNYTRPIPIFDANGIEIGSRPGEGFFDADQGTVRINSIVAHRALTNGILHVQVTYEIEFRVFPDTFIENYLDQDYRDINGLIFRDPRDDSKTLLAQGMDASFPGGESLMRITPGTQTLFPPAPSDPIDPITLLPNPNGVILGPHYHFFVRVDKEVVLVIKGADTPNWTVVRGQKGTTALPHSTAAIVSLEPYFLRFIPNGFADFKPLGLEGGSRLGGI